MTGSTQTVSYTSPGPIRMPPGSYLEPVEELPSDSDPEDYGDFRDIESVSDIVLSNIEEEGDDDDDDDDDEGQGSLRERDPVFEKIKESLSKTQRSESAGSILSSESNDSDGPHVQISEHYTSLPYGIQPKATYEHSGLHADIMGVAYNGRMRQFVILDSKGITTWKRDLVDPRVRRALQFPKYEYCLIRHIVFVAKYNCYFALSKDFSVKVLNRDFEETCSVNTNMRSVLFILFNPVRDELITGGVGGIKIWNFVQAAGKVFTELKPLANYELRLKESLPNVGGSWVKRVDLDYQLQHLYCCSDTDLHVYDLSGKLLFKFERAHTMSITGCCFSPTSKVLITSSVDSDVKVWSLTGGLVHTFRGHSRAVTSLMLHPETSSIIMTASLDGSIRMWSLDTMDLLYMIVVSADGVMWMGLTDDKLLYISTCRNITLWQLNTFYSFWALARSQLTSMSLASAEEKTTRILAVGDDNSVRIFNRSNKKNMTTVLPPPDISPLQKVLSLCYSREKNAAFLLVSSKEIWVYTTRTDPACRIAVWNVHDLQVPYISGDTTNLPAGVTIQPPSQSLSTHRATPNGHGNEIISNCCSLCILNSTAMMWTEEGLCCPLRHTYLLLGMEDGRILFMDPVIRGQKYMEFKASKDAIREIRQDHVHSCLVTLCRLKTLVQIQIWGLPQLDLLYELFCGSDITCYERVGLTMLTGHTSGQINYHMLEPAEDLGLLKSKQEPSYESVVDENRRPEHQGAVVAMDCLASLRLFVTCSLDGAIKVWDEAKVLMTEVMLEESLSAACFLNDMGDLLVGFKNHIFYIDHTKLCPAIKPEEVEMETSDQVNNTGVTNTGVTHLDLGESIAGKGEHAESDVYEDPRVLYELLKEEDEEITLENYLVPYDHLEFDKDFLEGKTKIEQPKTAAEAAAAEETESETETDISLAPSSIYLSPADSIESLSMIDLTLGADYSKYDLKDQMKATLDMVAKGKKKRKHVTIEALGQSDLEEKEVEVEMEKFSLPTFGESPGGSPSITPPSGQASPRSRHREGSEDELSDEERIQKKPRELPVGFIPVEPDQALSLRKVKSDSVFATLIASSDPKSDKHKYKSKHHIRHLSLTKPVIPKSQSNASKQTISKSKTLPNLTTKSTKQLGTKPEKVPVKPRGPYHEKTVVAQPKQSRQEIVQKVKTDNQTCANKSLAISSVTSITVDKQRPTPQVVPQPTDNVDKYRLNQDSKQPSKGFINNLNLGDQRLQKKNMINQKQKVDFSQKVNQPVDTYGIRKNTATKVTVSNKPELNRIVREKSTEVPQEKEKVIDKPLMASQQTGSFSDVFDNTLNIEDGHAKKLNSSLKQSSEFALVLMNLVDELSDEETAEQNQTEDDAKQITAADAENIIDVFSDNADIFSDKDSALTVSVATESLKTDNQDSLSVVTIRSINPDRIIEKEIEQRLEETKFNFHAQILEEKHFEESKLNNKIDVKETAVVETQLEEFKTQLNMVDDSCKSEKGRNNMKVPESDREQEIDDANELNTGNEVSVVQTHSIHPEGYMSAISMEEGKPTQKLEKPKAIYGDEPEAEATGSRRMKGVKVDVRGLMKKRRITSARAPSLTRRASTDHAHDDHDHDHDHSHDDHREIKKKQQQPIDRRLQQKMDKNKLMNLPPNPPSMLSRKRSLSEQRKNFELHLLHRPELRSQQPLDPEKMPHIRMEDDPDLDQLQEAQWAAEAGIHGTTLTLPPQRDKNQARQIDRPDQRSQRNRDRKFTLGDKDTPGVGSSPTSEMESPFGDGEKKDISLKVNDGDKSRVGAGENQVEENVEKDGDFGSNLDTNQPETQMQRAKRLGLKVDVDKVFEMEKADKDEGLPKVNVQRTKLKVYIPQAERESTSSARSSYRGSPDSGIEDLTIHLPQTPVITVKPEEEKKLFEDGDKSVKELTDEEQKSTLARPATSFTGLRRGQIEGEKLKTDRPHTAHVRFKAEDLQTAFEETLKKYQNLPGTPKLVSADTLYRNDGVNFEENWQERAIERHTLLRMQKEIRAQSAAQRRQAIEMIKQDKNSSKLFTTRCHSAAPQTIDEQSSTPAFRRANTSLSVPISFGYGVSTAPPPSRDRQRPKTANPVILKQQAIKNELSQEKAYRYKMGKSTKTPSRPSSSKSITTVADFSPHWIDPRNPDAWRPKSSRSIPSKCNRYVLVNKPKEKPSNPVPSPLEEQLLIERFPRMGAKVVQPVPDLTPRLKKSYQLEYSPFVYHRYM